MFLPLITFSLVIGNGPVCGIGGLHSIDGVLARQLRVFIGQGWILALVTSLTFASAVKFSASSFLWRSLCCYRAS